MASRPTWVVSDSSTSRPNTTTTTIVSLSLSLCLSLSVSLSLSLSLSVSLSLSFPIVLSFCMRPLPCTPADHPELRFNAAGFGWKSYASEENEPVTYSGADVRSAVWIRVARLWGVRLGMRQGDRRVGFDGFKREVSGACRGARHGRSVNSFLA
jgi:hypothetical protein